LDTEDPETFYSAASLLGHCGLRERALRLLRQAIERGYCSYPLMDNDPLWDSLRDDPEFLKIRENGIACRQSFQDYLDRISH
jgi:hypothetical protein